MVVAVTMAFGLILADLHYRQFDTLRSGLSVAIYPLHYLAALPTRLKREFDSRFAPRTDLLAQNVRLQEENLRLQGRLQRFVALESENARLRNLLGSAFKVGERVLIGELLEIDLDPYRQQVLIDKGARSGVFVGQPVLDAEAVMGQVVRTTPMTSTVLLITDPSHSLPVKVNRNGLRAIATGSGLIDQLTLLHVPKKADIRVGDLLVTSGLGGRFPEGYPVATVTRSDYVEGKPFAQIEAKPLVALDRLRYLLLLWTDKKPEVHDKDALEPAASASAATATSAAGATR